MSRRISSYAALLSGCLILLAGGVAAQPAPVDTSADSEVPPSETAEATRPLAERLRSVLERLDGFEGVSVEASDGLVLLSGEVDGFERRHTAEEVARALAPSHYIANSIDLRSDRLSDEETPASEGDREAQVRLERIFATVEELSDVSVATNDGIVHLTGTTSSESALERAVQLAQDQPGVVFVDDSVEVEATLGTQIAFTWRRVVAESTAFIGRLPMLGAALLIFFLAIFAAKTIRRAKPIGRLFTSHALLQTVTLRVVSTVIVLAGTLVALDLMEATSVVGAVLGTAGVVGIAIGFAFKDIVENYLAGMLLAVSRPFGPNDSVKVGEFEGKVVRLSARETVLMTYAGNHVQIPNAQVFANPVLNYTRNPRRRFDFTFGVGNGENLAEAQRLILGALSQMEGVMKAPAAIAQIDGFGDSSMLMHVYGWVDQAKHDFLKVKSEAVRQVKRVLDEAGVDMPNPIYQIINQDPATLEAREPEDVEPSRDLEVDRNIDQQIREEKADEASGEKDLLTDAK